MFTFGFSLASGHALRRAGSVGSRLGRNARRSLKARDYLAVFASEAEVRALKPDFAALRTLDCLGIIATAPGDDCDFVSRFFAPAAGVDEDPVTGSAHCTLIPYWAARLGKTKLFARQVSPRGGELSCELAGDRVRIGGTAVLYSKGEDSPGRCGLARLKFRKNRLPVSKKSLAVTLADVAQLTTGLRGAEAWTSIMKLTEIIPVLQVAIGPVILISGVGLLLLTMTNRLGRAIDRARQLAREVTSPDANRTQVAEQVVTIYRRARVLRLTIALAALSVLLTAFLIIVLSDGAAQTGLRPAGRPDFHCLPGLTDRVVDRFHLRHSPLPGRAPAGVAAGQGGLGRSRPRPAADRRIIRLTQIGLHAGRA